MRIKPFRDFVQSMTDLVNRDLSEPDMLVFARPLLVDLLRRDEWLPAQYAQPNPDRYQQYLLHCDPMERFSIVSFVWDVNQETPIHDHTVWGILGVLRGAEISQRYIGGDGEMHKLGPEEILGAGAIDMVSPRIGDIHKVSNGNHRGPSVSIHVYGGNIGRIYRHTYKFDGSIKLFVSGYSADTTPNLWGA